MRVISLEFCSEPVEHRSELARECGSFMEHVEAVRGCESLGAGEEARSASAPASPASSAASPKAGAKSRARPVRPRIDLDEQIAQATKLAEVSKRMLVAAKSAQKSQKKQKQRLIRKAGKLSAEDLERIAVLKRCGLYAEDGEDAADTGNARNVEDDAAELPVAGPADKKVKLSEVISKISGAEVVMQTLAGAQPSTGSASAAASSRDGNTVAGASGQGSGQPRARRLYRASSRARLDSVAEEAPAADDE